MVFWSACFGKPREKFRRFWRSRRDACLGKPRVHAKKSFRTSKTTSDMMKASPKYRSTLRRCTFRYGRDLWLHRCRQHCTCTWVTKNLELLKNSEFENISGLFGITRMMIEGNSEIKNVFSRRHYKFTLGKTCIAQRTSNKVDKRNSVRLLAFRVMLGKTARARICNKKVEWSSVNFEDGLYFQRIARIRWRSDWLRVENLPRSQNIEYSPQNSSRLTRKEHHTWKIQWSNNLHVNVQWHCIGREI